MAIVNMPKGNKTTQTTQITQATPAPAAPAQPSLEEQLAALQAENERLKAKAGFTVGNVTLKVSGRGALSFYGCGKMPITVYPEAATKLFSNAEDILKFMHWAQNVLAKKGDTRIELEDGQGLTARSDGYVLGTDFDKWAKTAKVYAPEIKAVKKIDMSKK